jgi:hypothetical protein
MAGYTAAPVVSSHRRQRLSARKPASTKSFELTLIYKCYPRAMADTVALVVYANVVYANIDRTIGAGGILAASANHFIDSSARRLRRDELFLVLV